MRIVAVSDLDFAGSGYFNIITPICRGLANSGHEVKVAGLLYKGEEHRENYTIIPAQTFEDAFSIVSNLIFIWPFDVLLIALDLTWQKRFLDRFPDKKYKFMGVFPVEADPVTFNWAMVMNQMDKPFIISEFGTQEALKNKVAKAEHLLIGMDNFSWRVPTKEEKEVARKKLGLEDKFVVFSVADNQERKNLAAAYEIVSKVSEEIENVHFSLVTRPDLNAGWDLDELAGRFGVQNNVTVFRRGMKDANLWLLYCAADVYLSTAKAEGLNMPTLEAMACGLPVVAGNHTALADHLADNRGFLIENEYKHVDPFCNGYRYWIDKEETASTLIKIARGEIKHDLSGALAYIENRKWENANKQIDRVLKEWSKETNG